MLQSKFTAKITIYVDQPTSNSRATWSGSPLDPDVGHTFIEIEQESTKRIFGFYPTEGVNPFTSPTDASSLVDDSNHPYDVKVEISVDASRLANVLNLAKNTPATYDLNTYNCTDFGIALSAGAGYVLSDKNGSWPGGGGSNPGDLGQEIRLLASSYNVVITKTSGNAPSNSGTCN